VYLQDARQREAAETGPDDRDGVVSGCHGERLSVPLEIPVRTGRGHGTLMVERL
jgi:hypothetical protein